MSKKKKLPKDVVLDSKQIESMYQKVKDRSLTEEDYKNMEGVFRLILWLMSELEKKKLSIKRLRRVFHVVTEKAINVLKKNKDDDASDEGNAGGASSADDGTSPKEKTVTKKKKGHGRKAASAYTGAERITIEHETLSPGSSCPECGTGTLYELKDPGVVVRIVGNAPLMGTVYEHQRLRCNPCGAVITAPLPESVSKKKYDERAGAMIALLKYGSGVPFFRLGYLQQRLGIPLAPSTQWDIVEKVANMLRPVYMVLLYLAAQGRLVHNDDTTARILNKATLSDLDNPDPKRTGIYTTGIISHYRDHTIALYHTGKKHAGENLDDLFDKRENERPPPLQMCDALTRNIPKKNKTKVANCLIHGRRNFLDVFHSFPDECSHVIKELSEVYKHEKRTRKEGMSDHQRLMFHKENSEPVMNELKKWLKSRLDEKKVEPNSSLGDAINYMRNHWEELTIFLKVPGAPLDNNIVERSLKMVILHRKNAYFFKTQFGAEVGDLFMSIIATCVQAKQNPFHYMVTIQKHAKLALKNPFDWLPWNYQRQLA